MADTTAAKTAATRRNGHAADKTADAWTEKLHLTILPCILRIQLQMGRRSEGQRSWDCWSHRWCHLRECEEGILSQILAVSWGTFVQGAFVQHCCLACVPYCSFRLRPAHCLWLQETPCKCLVLRHGSERVWTAGFSYPDYHWGWNPEPAPWPLWCLLPFIHLSTTWSPQSDDHGHWWKSKNEDAVRRGTFQACRTSTQIREDGRPLYKWMDAWMWSKVWPDLELATHAWTRKQCSRPRNTHPCTLALSQVGLLSLRSGMFFQSLWHCIWWFGPNQVLHHWWFPCSRTFSHLSLQPSQLQLRQNHFNVST